MRQLIALWLLNLSKVSLGWSVRVWDGSSEEVRKVSYEATDERTREALAQFGPTPLASGQGACSCGASRANQWRVGTVSPLKHIGACPLAERR